MTTPTYDLNIPQFVTDSFATTQPQFQRNFQTLFNAFMKNHVSLTAGATAGNHTFIELLEQLQPRQTDVSEISIYTKNVEGQTDQVFFRYQGNGQEFQFTNYQLYSLAQTRDRTQYFTILPGKIIVYMGSFRSLPNNILQLSPAIPKNIMSVSFCPFGTTVQQFQVYKPSIIVGKPNPDGFVDQIKVIGALGGNSSPPNCYYLILANI